MSDQILRLKCTKFNFGWGSAPDPAAGLYRAPRDPLAELRGPTSKGRGREAKGKGRKATEMGGDETPPLHAPPNPYFWIRSWESRILSIERRHFQWPWTMPTPSFKVTPFFDAEYLRNGTTYRHSFNEILIGLTYALLNSHFEWPWVS